MPLSVALSILAAAVVGAVAALVLRARSSGAADRLQHRIDGLLKLGRYEQAAVIALQHERLEEALEYYRRAQLPAKAAQVASRLARFDLAGELYERGGELERAAQAWTRGGHADRAAELLRTAAKKPAIATTVAPGGSLASGAATRPDLVAGALAKYEAARARSGGSEIDVAEVQNRARDAAEAMLAAGDIRGAARVFRDGGFDDEAIHLYANVLGMPGRAAAILASRGRLEQAAELYEVAGRRAEAARCWAEVARRSQAPEMYAERIRRLEASTIAPPDPAPREAVEGRPEHPTMTPGVAEQAVAEVADGPAVVAAVPVNAPSSAPSSSIAGARGAAPAVATSVVQRLLADDRLSPEELAAVAREAARAAVEQLRQADVQKLVAAGDAVEKRVARRDRSRATFASGLEGKPIPIDLVTDEAVRLARTGPSVEALQRYVAGRACTLQNIEVFYRLGLAHLSRGGWREALAHFDAVEEASPGYRNAGRRAEQIRGWLRAVGSARLDTKSDHVDRATGDSRYELLGELGRGGMAVVYRAEDRVLRRDVAMKFMSETVSAKPRRRELFAREARAVAQLNHPNVVTIYDFGVLEGRLFICMEYLDGTSMDARIEQEGRLPVLETLRIAKQVVDALVYAHARGVIHCDVKPSNVFLTSAGVVKLMDFGLARSVGEGLDASAIAGTPAYMAPEQITAKGIGPRADVFSLGVSLYEMLTGTLPFKGFDRATAPLRPSEIVATVPSAVDDFVLRAMSTDPDARFGSAQELGERIRAILDQVDSDALDR